MTIKSTKLGGTDWIDGDILYSADLLDTIEVANPYPQVVYTGSTFDSSRTSNGSTTANHTLQIAGGVINTYVIIELTLMCVAVSVDGSNYANAQIKVEVDQTGQGSLTSIFDQYVAGDDNVTNPVTHGSGAKTIRFYYAPTAGEKSTGLDVKITSTSTCVLAAGTTYAEVTNIQTVIYSV